MLPRRFFGQYHGRTAQYAYRTEPRTAVIPRQQVSRNQYDPDTNRNINELITPTAKISAREGVVFKHSPMFHQLKSYDEQMAEADRKRAVEAAIMSNKKEFDKEVEKEKKEEEKEKKRRKEKRDPTVREVRNYMQDMAFFHEKKVEKECPSVYPLLGINDDGNDDNSGGEEGNNSDAVADADMRRRARLSGTAKSSRGAGRGRAKNHTSSSRARGSRGRGRAK